MLLIMFRTFVKEFDFWRVAYFILKLSLFSLCGKNGNYVLIAYRLIGKLAVNR